MQPVEAKKPTWGYRLKKLVQRRRTVVLLSLALAMTILVALGAGIGKTMFDRFAAEARLADATTQTQTLLQQAKHSRESARSITVPIHGRSPEQKTLADSHWNDATVALAQLRLVLKSNPELPAHYHESFQELQTSLDFDLASRQLVNKLEQCILYAMKYDPQEKAYAREQARVMIEEAFQEFGISVYESPGEEAAHICAAMPEPFKIEVIEAVHFLVAETIPVFRPGIVSGEEQRTQRIHWWVEFLNQFDSDPWRIAMRQAAVKRNTAQMRDLTLSEAQHVSQQPPYTLLFLADSLSRMGEYQLAVDQLKLAQGQYSDNVWLTQYLGKALMYHRDRQDYLAAARYLTAAVSLSPENSMMHQGLGEALHHLGQYEDAAEASRRAIAISPDFVVAKQQLASSLVEVGQWEEAKQIYEELLEEDRQNPYIMGGLAVVLLRAGDRQQAHHYFRQALEQTPDDETAITNLANFYETDQDYSACLEVYRQAIARLPDHQTLRQAWGMAAIRAGKPEQAIEPLRWVCERTPQDFQSQYDLALALHHAKRYAEAIEHYDAALRIQPQNEMAQAGRESAVQTLRMFESK